MAAPTKAVQSELLAIQTVAAAAQLVSSEVDISGYHELAVYIDHARDASTTTAGNGTEYRIAVSQKASGNDAWRTIAAVESDVGAPSSIVTDGIEAAGQTVIECGATVPAIGDLVFFKHGTIGSSEWGRVVARVTTSGSETFTLQDALTNEQPQQTMYNKANQWVLYLPVGPFSRMRVVVHNNKGTTNGNMVCRVAWSTVVY